MPGTDVCHQCGDDVSWKGYARDQPTEDEHGDRGTAFVRVGIVCVCFAHVNQVESSVSAW
jgi:hypothetical protein